MAKLLCCQVKLIDYRQVEVWVADNASESDIEHAAAHIAEAEYCEADEIELVEYEQIDHQVDGRTSECLSDWERNPNLR